MRGGVDLKEAMADALKTRQRAELTRMGLAYCYGQAGVAGLWHQSIVNLLAAGAGWHWGFRPIPVETGPFLSKARNMIVSSYLKNDDQYLLFTDTDCVFTPQDVKLLMEADTAIAGATYYTAAAGSEPWVTALVEGDDGAYAPLTLPELPTVPDTSAYEDTEEDHARFARDLEAYQAAYLDPQFDPRPVVAVGMGLTLMRRDVVEAMAGAHEYPFEYIGNLGEDVVFCLRAKELGFEPMLVPRARIGHLKGVVL